MKSPSMLSETVLAAAATSLFGIVVGLGETSANLQDSNELITATAWLAMLVMFVVSIASVAAVLRNVSRRAVILSIICSATTSPCGFLYYLMLADNKVYRYQEPLDIAVAQGSPAALMAISFLLFSASTITYFFMTSGQPETSH